MDDTDFWKELEDEIGEPVLWYSLGELLSPFDNLSKNSVGMFFLTEASLYFQTFPKNDFFRVLANSFRRNKKDGGRIQQGYPLSGIISATIEGSRGFLKSVRSMPVVAVEFDDRVFNLRKDEPAPPSVMRFTLLDKTAGNELLRRIGKGTEDAGDA